MRTTGRRLLAFIAAIVVLPTSPGWTQTTTISAVLQSAAAANGNGTAVDVTGYSLITVQITLSGAPAFTANFEVSLDTTNFDAGYCMPIAGGATVTTATAIGEWRCNVTGHKRFRARISGYTGPGSITVLGVLFAAKPAILGSDSVASQRAGR